MQKGFSLKQSVGFASMRQNDIELKMGLCNKVVASWKMYFEIRLTFFAESSYPLQGHGSSAKGKAIHYSIVDLNWDLIYQINDKNVLNL